MTAHSASFPSDNSRLWRDLYRLALFETDRDKISCRTDRDKISCRISEAQRALVSREHELFKGSADTAERAAVTNSLHVLNAFRKYGPARNDAY